MKRSLMSFLLAMLALFYFTIGMQAHENKKIHPALTKRAWDSLPPSQKDSVLASFGTNDADLVEFTRKVEIIEDNGVQQKDNYTLVDWLRQGAIEEDMPDRRCLAHFYNPLADKGEVKYGRSLSDPIRVTGSAKRDSQDWAMTGESFTPPAIMMKGTETENEESWVKVRGYYVKALTELEPAKRKEASAHTFYALGKILHLLQDLSQPEHVRNDAHMVNGPTTPPLGKDENGDPTWLAGQVGKIIPRARWIENYGEDHGVDIINALGEVSALDWRAAGFKRVTDFWDREMYDKDNDAILSDEAANDEADMSKRLGLAEFVNGNFLGGNASYEELTRGGTKHNFPHPALTDTNFHDNVNLVQLANTWTNATKLTPDKEQLALKKYMFLDKTNGYPVKHHSLLTYTGFKKIQRGGNLGEVTQSELPVVTINSATVLNDYHEILFRKAVEYSAGLLDYFFRGKLSADCYFDETSGKYHLLVSNVSGQPFHGGSFEVYFDDAAGNRTKYTGVTDDYSPQGTTRTLESSYGVEGFWEYFLYGYYSWYEDLGFPCVRIEIPVPNSTAGLAATKAIVVYKEGIIGGKKADGTAEDSVDEAKAVAAVHFDLPKIVAPIPGVEAASRSASKYKYGAPGMTWDNNCGHGSTNNNRYLRIDYTPTTPNNNAGCSETNGLGYFNPIYPAGPSWELYTIDGGFTRGGALFGWVAETLSSPYTTPMLIAHTIASLPAYGAFAVHSPSASRNLSTDELSYAIADSVYRFRFNPGAVPAGLGYRLSWVERFLPAITYNASNQVTGGGSALNRIDVVNGGTGYKTATVDSYMDGTGGVEVYVNDGGNGYAFAPTVALPAPPVGSNGTQATAHAVVSNGAVTEIIMDNNGSGYTDAPVLTLAAPTGSANPVIVISAPSGNGGTQATATATLNAAGQIQSISLNAAGSRYTGAPSVYVSSSPNGLGQGATFAVHLGTETEKTATWSGPVSGNYSASDSSTWPVIGPYELAVPATYGTTTVQNVKAEITAGP